MKADSAWVWGTEAAPGRVIDFHGDQRLARDIGNGRLEVPRYGLRFAIMGVDEAGHREGEGGAGGGDDGSDLHRRLQPAVRRSNPERVATGSSGALRTDVVSRTAAARTHSTRRR